MTIIYRYTIIYNKVYMYGSIRAVSAFVWGFVISTSVEYDVNFLNVYFSYQLTLY